MRRWLAIALILLAGTPAGAASAETGIASVYSSIDRDQNGTRTASGIPLDDSKATVAHNTRPLRSLVVVTNLDNGRTRTFPVTDRGPHRKGRIIDLSVEAGRLLGCSLCRVVVR